MTGWPRRCADGVRVVLLANHGVLVVGESAAVAWYDLYFFERACMAQVLAASTGQAAAAHRPTRSPLWPPSSSTRSARLHSPLLFAAERRRLDRELPGYDG